MSTTPPRHRPRPLIDLLVSLLIPSAILMKLSSEQRLGADGALLLALAFPLGWGAYEALRFRKFNLIALLGLISVLLTGGIGLLRLDAGWLAIKEATVPALIGLAVLVSNYTRYPLIRSLLYNERVIDVAKVARHLAERDNSARFEQRLRRATWWLAGTFFFSAAMNYLLARWIVVSAAGSEAFNAELGRMNLLSYPVIVAPSTLMLVGILYYLWRTIRDLTGLDLEQIMVQQR